MALTGHHAYVTAFYAARLTVIDVSNPTSPTIVGSLGDWTHMAYPNDVAVSGNDAYVADQTSGTSDQLTVVDVSQPTHPTFVTALSNSAVLGGAYRVRVRGPFAFVAASSAATVAARDISSPANPRLSGSVSDDAHLHGTTGFDLDATGRYVVAASGKLAGEAHPLYPPYPDQPGRPHEHRNRVGH